jgi:hypothetical protein
VAAEGEAMNPRRVLLATAALILLAGLFPPAESVPSIDFPTVTRASGFVFIGAMEPRQQVRLGQWVVELALLAAAGGLVALAVRPRP